MSELRSVTRLVFGFFSIAALSAPPAAAADVVVGAGSTVTGQKTIGGTDKVTVGAGGKLTSSLNPTISQTSATSGAGIIIDNSGTIESTGTGTRAIRFSTGTSMSFTLTNEVGATIQSQNDAINISPTVTSGVIAVNNYGLIQATGVNSNNGQSIDFGNVAGATVVINNYATGVLKSADADGIRPGNGATINNYGQIIGKNYSTGNGPTDTTNSGADGIDFQNSTSGTVNNYSGGIISGDRHGINIGNKDQVTNPTPAQAAAALATGITNSISVFNDVGGQIIGQNGSGVGSDVSGTVLNYGLISGRADAIQNVANGDGDGVDIDYIGHITNYGTIEGTGAKGVGSDGLINTSQGVALGGGDVDNKAGAVIRGRADGILVDNSSEGPAFAAVSITNAGTIEGTTRYGIAIVSDFNNTITNSGAITGVASGSGCVATANVDADCNAEAIKITGSGNNTITNLAGGLISVGAGSQATIRTGTGNDTLSNSGTINGSIDLDGGANALNNLAGGRLNTGAYVKVGVGNTVSNAGTIAPGGSGTIATTSLTGNLVQTSTGVLAVDLDGAANSADRLNVSGMASLSGEVQVALKSLTITSGTVTILNAAGGITNNGLSLVTGYATPVVSMQLIYPDANDVALAYSVSFAQSGIGLTDNELALGSHLNGIFLAGGSAVTTALLNLTSTDDYKRALDQLSPEAYAQAGVSQLDAVTGFGNSLLSCRVKDGAYIAVSEGQCLWADVSGSDYDNNAKHTLGVHEQAWRFAGGAQVKIAPKYYLGIAFGTGQSWATTGSSAKTEGQQFFAGTALKYTSGPWLLAAAIYGGTASYETTRWADFGRLSSTVHGLQDIPALSGRARLAYQFGTSAFYAKPMADVEVTELWLGSFTETGGPIALSATGSTDSFVRFAPAIEVGGDLRLSESVLARPFLRLGASVQSESAITIDSAFVTAPASAGTFATQASLDRVTGTVSVGLDLFSSGNAELKFYYDGAFGADTKQHAFGGKASYNF